MAAPAPCGCMATSHPLFSLCLECGRILCAAEAWGFCVACGAPLGDGGGGGVGGGAAHAAALAAKERLLLFDRTAAARTRVLDDDEEYFASAPAADAGYDAFLSPAENAAAAAAAAAARAAQRARGRGGMTFTLDLGAEGGGVRVVDEARVAREGARRGALDAMAASRALARADAFHGGGGGGDDGGGGGGGGRRERAARAREPRRGGATAATATAATAAARARARLPTLASAAPRGLCTARYCAPRGRKRRRARGTGAAPARDKKK